MAADPACVFTVCVAGNGGAIELAVASGQFAVNTTLCRDTTCFLWLYYKSRVSV
jgi:hypothetical protein